MQADIMRSRNISVHKK